MKNTYIYYLHKDDDVPFYIGKTINKTLRSAEHRWRNKGNCKPTMVIIDEIPSKDHVFWEKYYISLFKSWGFKLENRNKGGGGVSSHNKTSRQKISDSLTGKSHSEISKNKMRESALGRKNTKSQKLKLSKSLKEYYKNNEGSFKGKQHTEETKLKIRKPVEALKEGIVVEKYNSLKEAGLKHKTHSGNIIKTIKRKGTLHGLFWRYIN